MKKLPDVCRDCSDPLTEENRTSDGNRRCKTCQNSYARTNYAANREKRAAQRKAIRESNLERANAWYRAYYAENKETILSSIRARRESAPEKQRAYNKRWYDRNPGYTAEANRKRRTKMAGAVCTLTKQEWEEILESFNHSCAYCLRANVHLTMDHVLAIASGGDHIAENVVPSCTPCNTRKQARGVLSVVNTPRWSPTILPYPLVG